MKQVCVLVAVAGYAAMGGWAANNYSRWASSALGRELAVRAGADPTTRSAKIAGAAFAGLSWPYSFAKKKAWSR